MVILDALFAALLFKLFGVNALYILAITCCVSFLRSWGKVGFVFGIYKDAIEQKILEQQTQQEEEQE